MRLSIENPVKQGKTARPTQPAIKHEILMSQRLMQQRKKLLELRGVLLERVKQLSSEACEETPNYSMHMADAASDSFDRDLTLGLVSFEQEALYEIDAALKRIEDGTYGVCELTGQPIPWPRLAVIPWTRFSLDAEKAMESGIHPHIGDLGTIRPPEIETTDEEIPEGELLALTAEAVG